MSENNAKADLVRQAIGEALKEEVVPIPFREAQDIVRSAAASTDKLVAYYERQMANPLKAR